METRLTSRESQARIKEGELGGRLAGLSLPRQVLALALWPFLEQVLGFLTSATDLVIAGRMGNELEVAPYLEALAVAAYVGWLVFIVQGAISTGATALVSRSTGARNALFVNVVTSQVISLSLIIGLAMTALVGVGASFIAGTLFGLEGRALEVAVSYLAIFAWSSPFSAVVFSLNACLRGAGNTSSPFQVMVMVNIVNVVTSLVFVCGVAPIGGHGIDGLAMGTVLGWAAGAILVVFKLARGPRDDELGEPALRLNKLRPDAETTWRVLRIGLPTATEIFFIWIIQVQIARYISSLAAEGPLAAHMMAIRLESMSFLPGFAIGIAASTLTGQYLGAGNPERAREAILYCLKVAMTVMTLLGLSLVFFAGHWVSIIAPASPSLIEQSRPIVIIAGLIQPLMAVSIIMRTAMRGAGDSRRVMIYGIGNQIFWRVIVLWICIHSFQIGLVGIWSILAVDLVSASIVFTWLFRHGKWTTAKV